jgi:hypothetical protein
MRLPFKSAFARTMLFFFFFSSSIYVATAAREDEARGCPALFAGEECAELRANLPECVDGAFDGGWISLHRNAVVVSSSSSSSSSSAAVGEEEGAAKVNDEDGEGNYWRAPRDISEETAAMLPEFDVFGTSGRSRRAAAKSCALVSSGASMSGSNLGAEIDANEIVVRFNNAPTKGYEADVGGKTSLRLTNAIFQGYREKDGEAVLAKWCQEASRAPCGTRDELTRLIDKKAHGLNPRFFDYANSRYFRKLGEHPSSGMVMTLLLLHKCEKVTLYGFNGKQLKRWYYPKRKKGENAPKKKDWLREKRWTVDGDWVYARPTSDSFDDDPNVREDEEFSEEEEEESVAERRTRRRIRKQRRFSRSSSSSSSSSWNLLSRRGLLLATTDNRTSDLTLRPPSSSSSISSDSDRAVFDSSSTTTTTRSAPGGVREDVKETEQKKVHRTRRQRRTLLHAVKAERACVDQLQALGFLSEANP